ncbi:MAG: DUF1592 domain-containing protein, partial [Verrucomicrobiota bacterium]
WRLENPEEALEDRLGEFFEGEFEEEDEEMEEEETEELSGPIYTPAPEKNVVIDDLAGVKFDYAADVIPALEKHCFECHDSESAMGDIDLETALTETPLVRNRRLWENVAERIRGGDMPPEDEPKPNEATKLQLRAWLAKEVEEFDYSTVRNPGYLSARRLTREEYNRTIRDLIGLDLRPADSFPMDFSGTSGFSNSANTLFLQTAHLDRYFTAADDVIDAARTDEQTWAALTQGGSEAALRRFMRHAWRRTPSDAEVHEIRDDDLARAFKVALISPNFLLRVEEETASGEDAQVSAIDLATRLSYFIWASTPDDELLAAAESGELLNPDRRAVQIDRMLDDPRSLALGDIFAAEWFGSDDLGPRIRKDPIDNPWCTETLMASMRDETALFFHSLVAENAPISQLINADYTFLNDELAEFYRIDGVDGNQMQRVALETDRRGGLFGHGSILATTSFPNRTSPVVRGTWILDTLLGTPPPPPPPNVPEVEVEGGGRRAAATLRARLERHRESKNCAGCHDQIDPLGFALESYAEFGQWRSGVDNRGTLPNGAEFRGAEGLKLALIDNRLDDLGSQVTRKMLAYGLGRQLEFYDEAIVREIAAKLKPDGYRLRDLVHEIANSYPFTTKRAP